MIYRTLGRTGLEVSVMGMGTGGHDPLGVKSGRAESEMLALLHRAFDLGIRLFDSSPGYGRGHSEQLLGRALASLPRDQLVVTTKIALAGSMPDQPVEIMKPSAVVPAVEESLRRLDLDYLDVMLIAVADLPEKFDLVIEELIPELDKVKQQGKIRFLGSSEQTRTDGTHLWLQRILPTDLIDVAMVGHNMINQSARRLVFPVCQRQNIGVMNVFTVRNLFWNPPRLQEVISDLKQRGFLDAADVPDGDPLGWLLEEGDCDSLVEAAYRYAAYTPAVSTTMCGTLDQAELEEDVQFIEKGPLPSSTIERLTRTFKKIAEPIGN